MSIAGVESFAPYKGRCVLYLAITVSDIIRNVAQDVVSCARDAGVELPQAAVQEQWIPHCTLSRRIRPVLIDEALAVVQSVPLPKRSSVRAVVHGRGAGIPADVLSQLPPDQEVRVNQCD
jgi:2'-5' RNA ligase